jgi:hypothetical protein
MMRTSRFVCVFVAAILMVPVMHAKDILVHMSDGSIIQGELLLVRDTSLLLGSATIQGREETLDLMRVPFDSIWQVDIRGGSQMWIGAFAGFVAGTITGVATAPPPGGFLGDMTLLGAIGGGLLGALVGGGIGSLITTDDVWVTAVSPGGFSALRVYARYENEAAYVNRVH